MNETPPPPRPPTEFQLRQAAVRHVERFVPSIAQVTEALWRRVRKATGLMADGTDAAPVIRAIVTDFVQRGILDDHRLARTLVTEWQRRGDPLPAMRGKLMRKRIPSAISAQVLAELNTQLLEQGVDPTRQRAIAYARRRRLGPWRFDPIRRADRRQKDLAALGRVGIPWALASEIVDHEDGDALLAELVSD